MSVSHKMVSFKKHSKKVGEGGGGGSCKGINDKNNGSVGLLHSLKHTASHRFASSRFALL